MEYTEVINLIDNKRRFGKACGRDVTRELLELLGHPEKGMHIVHIAGTNGKGSVAAFVSSILQAASFSCEKKFKVGLFTSPHLIEYTERIQIDGVQISRDDVARIGTYLLGLETVLEPTMFDYWLAMALIYFRENNVDYLVLETGLGGAKDSTNGLEERPKVCAITSIGLEHTQYLGNTLEEIAGEKAGILKENVPVVIGPMDKVAASVIAARANQLGCDLYQPHPVDNNTKLGLFGKYQQNNAAVAEKVAQLLLPKLDSQIIAKGLANAVWPGRMQVISDSPFILVDGAHNPGGVQALCDSLVYSFKNERFSFIMAVMADKDYLEMADIVKPIAARFYTVTVESDRALQAESLAEAIRSVGCDATSQASYQDAIASASAYEEKIIIFGSLYFIGEILHDQNEGPSA